MNTGGMARCTVCHHDQHEVIDTALASGDSLASVARRFGLSPDAVRRHRIGHLSAALKAVQAERETAGARTALDRLEALHDRAERVLAAAEAEGKASLSLQAIRELRSTVELIARLTGELDDRPQVQVLNVTASPEWDALRGVVLSALRPFPEAGRAVALALEAGS